MFCQVSIPIISSQLSVLGWLPDFLMVAATAIIVGTILNWYNHLNSGRFLAMALHVQILAFGEV